MNSLARNIPWIFSGIGVYALSLLIGLAVLLLRRYSNASPQLRRLVGNYEALQFRIRNIEGLLRSPIFIQRRGIGGLRAELHTDRYHYVGNCIRKGQNLFFILKGKEHDAYFYLIFKEPLGSFNLLVGVYASITRDRQPLAGRIVLRRSELTDKNLLRPGVLSLDEVPRTITDLLLNTTGNRIIVEDHASLVDTLHAERRSKTSPDE